MASAVGKVGALLRCVFRECGAKDVNVGFGRSIAGNAGPGVSKVVRARDGRSRVNEVVEGRFLSSVLVCIRTVGNFIAGNPRYFFPLAGGVGRVEVVACAIRARVNRQFFTGQGVERFHLLVLVDSPRS